MRNKGTQKMHERKNEALRVHHAKERAKKAAAAQEDSAERSAPLAPFLQGDKSGLPMRPPAPKSEVS